VEVVVEHKAVAGVVVDQAVPVLLAPAALVAPAAEEEVADILAAAAAEQLAAGRAL
jgi:FAD/FMN-containing dehydrogenase